MCLFLFIIIVMAAGRSGSVCCGLLLLCLMVHEVLVSRNRNHVSSPDQSHLCDTHRNKGDAKLSTFLSSVVLVVAVLLLLGAGAPLGLKVKGVDPLLFDWYILAREEEGRREGGGGWWVGSTFFELVFYHQSAEPAPNAASRRRTHCSQTQLL